MLKANELELMVYIMALMRLEEMALGNQNNVNIDHNDLINRALQWQITNEAQVIVRAELTDC